MAKLHYVSPMSLDGYIGDGHYDWSPPGEGSTAFITEIIRPFGTYLYGRRNFETMSVWDSPEFVSNLGPDDQEFARVWRSAEKIVYSKSLQSVTTQKTRLASNFEAQKVREMKRQLPNDICIGGPSIAAQAIRDGLVDEIHLFVVPSTLQETNLFSLICSKSVSLAAAGCIYAIGSYHEYSQVFRNPTHTICITNGMFKRITLFIALLGSTAQGQTNSGSVERYNEYVSVAQIGTRAITIIGWSHLDDDEIARAKAGLDETLLTSRSKDCAKSSQKLGETLNALSTSVRMKDYVLKLLDAVNSETPLQSLGLELTPSELEQSWRQLDASRSKMNEISSACGPVTQKNVEAALEIVQGPELTFALKHGGPSMLLALEDEKAKSENAKSFDQNIPFNDRDPRIDESSRKSLEALWKLALEQKQPDDSLFDRGVAFTTDTGERTRLKSDLKTTFAILYERIRGAYIRNTYIAKNAIASKGNLAIVVGYAHVDDLIRQLMSQCKQK